MLARQRELRELLFTGDLLFWFFETGTCYTFLVWPQSYDLPASVSGVIEF